MLEVLRFARYALRFERAFRTDRWDAVRRSFHDDATYEIAGSGSTYEGIVRGADAIVDVFQRMLNEVDRKYDRRQPRLVGWPRTRAGELEVGWSVRYLLGAQAVILTGTSRCQFDSGRIRRLHDTMHPEECRRWFALVAA